MAFLPPLPIRAPVKYIAQPGFPMMGFPDCSPIPLGLLILETPSRARCPGPGNDSDHAQSWVLAQLKILFLCRFPFQLTEEVCTHRA